MFLIIVSLFLIFLIWAIVQVIIAPITLVAKIVAIPIIIIEQILLLMLTEIWHGVCKSKNIKGEKKE